MLKVIKFSADWCRPCHMLAPIFEKVAQSYTSGVEFKTVNIDDNQELASKYGINSIPTIIFLQEGLVVKTLVGLQKEQTIRDAIEQLKE